MSERLKIQDVNIELGDEVSNMLYEASKATHENRPGLLVEFHESFSGARAIPVSMLSDPENTLMNLGFDGVGTKVEISERLDDHSSVAYDLFAMVCDDAVVRGAEPVAIGSILDVRNLGDPDDPASIEHAKKAVMQLAAGYIGAAAAAGVVVVNGEVAELGNRISGFDQNRHNLNYNWGAAVLWFAHKDRLLTGYDIAPGDTLVGFAEQGFRSNGITDVRKIMEATYGSKWHAEQDYSGNTLGKVVGRPSIIYSKLVTALTGGFDINRDPKANITGVAHITGGGQPSKLGRMLEPSGLGATIDRPISPPGIMKNVQKLGNITDKRAYSKWHMGPGMVVATTEPHKVIEEAESHGIVAQEIGYVDDKPGIRIKNLGAAQDSEWLEFTS